MHDQQCEMTFIHGHVHECSAGLAGSKYPIKNHANVPRETLDQSEHKSETREEEPLKGFVCLEEHSSRSWSILIQDNNEI